MAFKRTEAKAEYARGAELIQELVGIGLKFAASSVSSIDPKQSPNIEDALIGAAIEGVEREDYRVLSLLTDWFEVHGEWVNVDRLVRAVRLLNSNRVKAYFAAIGKWLSKDPRYKRLAAVYGGKRVPLGMGASYGFLVDRNGEDDRFQKTKLIVAAGNLRRRKEDIMTPQELAKTHQDYYWRVCLGPSYRADMISLYNRRPQASPSEIARDTYGSFQTAWFVKRDISIIASLVNPSLNLDRQT